MNTWELTALITAAANVIAEKLNTNQLNLLATALFQLGDTLTTIAVQREILEGESGPPEIE